MECQLVTRNRELELKIVEQKSTIETLQATNIALAAKVRALELSIRTEKDPIATIRHGTRELRIFDKSYSQRKVATVRLAIREFMAMAINPIYGVKEVRDV